MYAAAAAASSSSAAASSVATARPSGGSDLNARSSFCNLTEREVRELSKLLYGNEETFGHVTRDGLNALKLTDLKKVIKFLRETKFILSVRSSGVKQEIVDRLTEVLEFKRSGTTSHFPSPKVTIKLSSHIPSPAPAAAASTQPQARSQLILNVLKKNPSYEVTDILSCTPLSDSTVQFIVRDAAILHIRIFSFHGTNPQEISINPCMNISLNGERLLVPKPRKMNSRQKHALYFTMPIELRHPKIRNGLNALWLSGSHAPNLFLVVASVREVTTTELIPKIATIAGGFSSHHSEEDIQVANTEVSLRCPVTFVRMETAAKGVNCRHLQDFDLKSYLTFSLQHQMWMCPVCLAQLPLQDLRIDTNFNNVLNSVPKKIDRINVLPDGSWSIRDDTADATSTVSKKSRSSTNGGDVLSGVLIIDDDDDDGPSAHSRRLPHSAPKPSLNATSLPEIIIID